jgi:hypothetical protein
VNCKPGDLAVVIGEGPHEGKIIKVTHYEDVGCGPEWFFEGTISFYSVAEGQMMDQLTFFDSVLKPLRDSDGTDETLTWKTLETQE